MNDSNIGDILKRGAERFREKLAEKKRVIRPADFGLVDDPSIEWHFPPPTTRQGDAILKFVNEGKLLEGQVEALFQRGRTPDGKKLFPQTMRNELLKQDPEVIAAIAAEIGAFDDISPAASVEEMEKNFETTRKSETECS